MNKEDRDRLKRIETMVSVIMALVGGYYVAMIITAIIEAVLSR